MAKATSYIVVFLSKPIRASLYTAESAETAIAKARLKWGDEVKNLEPHVFIVPDLAIKAAYWSIYGPPLEEESNNQKPVVNIHIDHINISSNDPAHILNGFLDRRIAEG